MRRMRRDVISFLLPLTLPLAMIAFSLCGSFGFKTAEQSARPPAFAAFVELSPEAEARATAAVKAAWQGDSGGIKRIRADLSVGELPEEVPGPVLEVSPEAFRIPGAVLSSELPPLPPDTQITLNDTEYNFPEGTSTVMRLDINSGLTDSKAEQRLAFRMRRAHIGKALLPPVLLSIQEQP